jgi:hypothetical protein
MPTDLADELLTETSSSGTPLFTMNNRSEALAPAAYEPPLGGVRIVSARRSI